MINQKRTVAQKRNYAVTNVQDAKTIVMQWLLEARLANATDLGLPEVDDRYHIWRIPVLKRGTSTRVGEVVLDAYTSLILDAKTTSVPVIEARLLGRDDDVDCAKREQTQRYSRSYLRNIVAQGDSEMILQELPTESVDLVFTSPPYFNARPEYNDYIDYEEYLLKMRKIIRNVHRVLGEGRFFVMNIAPVLIRRASRSEASRRIAVPFDMHRIFIEEQFDFIDDIVWEKPEGAGWATGRGRRFAADRTPLQYKAVPVTEYVLVYRKRTNRLIDWNIRNHHNSELVKTSKVMDEYERTNIWRIKPTHDKRHPAVFPLELAERVISYYSFKDDVILDPFAGIGTVGNAAARLERRFVLIEQDANYVEIIREEVPKWIGTAASQVFTMYCEPIKAEGSLL